MKSSVCASGSVGQLPGIKWYSGILIHTHKTVTVGFQSLNTLKLEIQFATATKKKKTDKHMREKEIKKKKEIHMLNIMMMQDLSKISNSPVV